MGIALKEFYIRTTRLSLVLLIALFPNQKSLAQFGEIDSIWTSSSTLCPGDYTQLFVANTLGSSSYTLSSINANLSGSIYTVNAEYCPPGIGLPVLTQYIDSVALGPLPAADFIVAFNLHVAVITPCVSYVLVDSTFMNVSMPSAVTVPATGLDTSICVGDTVQLLGQFSGGIAPYSFLWSPASGVSGTTNDTVLAWPTTNSSYNFLITDGCGQQANSTFNVDVEPCGGTNFLPEVSHLRLPYMFPNPVENVLRIEFDLEHAPEAEISIYNLTGREVSRIRASSSAMQLGVSFLPKGIYQVVLNHANGGTEVVGRFLKN